MDHVEKVDSTQFTVASDFVKLGYGQTVGGYMTSGDERPDQKEHFINYYKDKTDRTPSFTNLWCPELMLFIAEILGLNREYIEEARDYVMTIEDKYELRGKDKGATYLSFKDETGENVLVNFKKKLKIYEINKILRECANLEEALRKISDI